MKGPTTSRSTAVVSAFVSAIFLWTLALSVSPWLHERIHSDANRIEHSCAVTFVASGSCDHATQPTLFTPAAVVDQFAQVATLTPLWVASPFLCSHIFEHAPPAIS